MAGNGTENAEAWFSDLWWRYRGPVVRYLARFVRDHDQIEDIVQQTFIEAWHKRGAIQGPPMPWLFAVARNLASDHWQGHLRGQAMWERLCAEPLSDDGGMGYSELWRDVAEACKALTPKERECLLLAVNDDLTDEEIAGVLRISRDNVRQQRHRARAKLQSALREVKGRRVTGRAGRGEG
ncbi:MAG TPA: sigma-70 family RNA polymerase sigma factor [Pilimelia sp.]|nr:sigma-70 family RNA polymerase sigma factor [Pilimelia sp.]